MGRFGLSAALILCAVCLLPMPAAVADVRIDPALLEKLAVSMADRYEHTDRFDAEVWLVTSERRLARYMNDHDERLALLQTVYREADRNALDADLVLSLIHI